jgi:hypothetical protein
MIQAIIITISVLLVVGYIYSRWDVNTRHYDWLYKKHDDDDDENKPPRCPNCGW